MIPRWIPETLIDELVSSYPGLPLTICVTNDAITFCRGDGALYTHLTPVQDLATSTFDELPDLSQDAEPAAALTPVEDSLPYYEPVGDPTSSTALNPPVADDTVVLLSSDADDPTAVPSVVPRHVRTLLDDIATAPLTAYEDLSPPAGGPLLQCAALLCRYQHMAIRTGRGRVDEPQQLHIAYLLGKLYREHQTEVQGELNRVMDRRQRANIRRGLKRAYAVVSRIGLARLYGTTVLSYNRIRDLSVTDYTTFLLPGLPQSSRDLAFIGGEDVIPRPPSGSGSDDH